jgi:mannitol-1-phosphate 5-dehydrogenase
MKRPRAVVFGAGKMACGLLGQLLAQSGYTTLFVARRPEIIAAINCQQGYSLNIAGEELGRLAIRHCHALSIQERRLVADALAAADVVCTAVGIDNLAAITPPIAEGLWQRSDARGEHPLNVVACENLPGAGAYLRHQVVSAAPLEQEMAVEGVGGFSAALTRRIMTGGAIEHGELTFTVDADYDLIIDMHGLKGALPDVQGATFTEEFPAMVMRKLFTLNCAHAVAAYLGYREGCRYIHEAAPHPRVAPTLQGAVAEAKAALQAEFPHQAEAIDREAAEALERIANARLADTISRVARGPRRKLSPRERLVGPARLARQHNLPYENLCVAIAAALAYDDPEDPQAVAMQQAIVAEGVEKVLTEDCGLLPHEELALAVKQRWLELVGGSARGGAPAFGPFSRISPSLEEITQAVALDLSRRYDPDMVQDVLARVTQEFREARVWSYVPILMKKTASEQLRGVAR